jgi:hypothetical protein
MFLKFSRFMAIAALTTFTCITANETKAQERDPSLLDPTTLSVDVIRPGSSLNLPQLMNQAYWQNSGTFFRQTTSLERLNSIFGWYNFPEGSYAENSVARDGLLINIIVDDHFKQLQQREPTIRTRDLTNPFDSSLNENPSYVR